MVEITCLSASASKIKLPEFAKEFKKAGFESLLVKMFEKTRESMISLTGVDVGKFQHDKEMLFPMLFSYHENGKKGCVLIDLIREIGTPTTIEITCFAGNKNSLFKLTKLIKDILIQQIGFEKKQIFNGTVRELLKSRTLNKLVNSPQGNLINNITPECLNAFLDKKMREKLRQLVIGPFLGRFFPLSIVGPSLELTEDDIKKLGSLGIFRIGYTAYCSKCEEVASGQVIFRSPEEVEELLRRKVTWCATCGTSLDTKTARIELVCSVSDMGRALTQGLWLEAYVKSIIEKSIAKDNIRASVYHGNDELDVVFLDLDTLDVIECKDKTVGLNDMYVLTMKAARLKADNAFLVSTRKISKDVLSSMKDEDRFGFMSMTGDVKTIKRALEKHIGKMRENFKRSRLQQLAEIVLPFAFPDVERFLARQRWYRHTRRLRY